MKVKNIGAVFAAPFLCENVYEITLFTVYGKWNLKTCFVILYKE